MASPVPQEVLDQITKTRGVLASVKAYLDAEPARHQAVVDAAVAAALDLGATADQLAPVKAIVDELAVDTDAVAAAIAANP
jgi:hypothetical protein